MTQKLDSADYDRSGRKRSEFHILHPGRFHPDSMGARLQALCVAVSVVGGVVAISALWTWLTA